MGNARGTPSWSGIARECSGPRTYVYRQHECHDTAPFSSADCHEVAAFSSGLAAAPGYDEESEDDLRAPSLDRPGELELDSAPSAAAAAAPALQLLSSAAAAVGAASRAAGQMVAASVGPAPQPVREDSDSEFELIGEEEALAAAHR